MNCNYRNRGIAVLIIVMLFLCTSVFAQETAPSERSAKERIDYIQGILDEGETRAQVWWYGWLAFNAGVTVGQGAYYFMSTEADVKEDMAVGAVQGFIATVGMLAVPMVPAYAPDELREMPENTPEQQQQKLLAAERLLRESAEWEQEGRSWIMHAATFLLGAAGGATIWLAFDRPVDGLINFAATMVIGEIQIFTQPTRAIDDNREYRNRYRGARRDERNWFIMAYPGGFIAGVHF
jgi:hypothetical protein